MIWSYLAALSAFIALSRVTLAACRVSLAPTLSCISMSWSSVSSELVKMALSIANFPLFSAPLRSCGYLFFCSVHLLSGDVQTFP